MGTSIITGIIKVNGKDMKSFDQSLTMLTEFKLALFELIKKQTSKYTNSFHSSVAIDKDKSNFSIEFFTPERMKPIFIEQIKILFDNSRYQAWEFEILWNEVECDGYNSDGRREYAISFNEETGKYKYVKKLYSSIFKKDKILETWEKSKQSKREEKVDI